MYWIAGPQHPSERLWRRVGLLGLVCSSVVVGCSVSVESNDAIESREQIQVVLDDVERASVELHPSCDVGGDVEQCLVATTAMIDQLDSSIETLEAADLAINTQELAEVLGQLRDGFEKRAEAITTDNDELWTESNDALMEADTRLRVVVEEL